MENQNNTKNVLVVILLLLLVVTVGYIGYDKFIAKEETQTMDNIIDNNSISNSKEKEPFTFDDYAVLLENKNVVEMSEYFDSNYSVLSRIYLKNGNVYASINDVNSLGLSDSDKEKIKNLKLEQVIINNATLSLYKLPIENVILFDVVLVGDSGKVLILETKEGKVYSFVPDQTGQAAYSFFSENGTMNLKEESNLKNIIKFGSLEKEFIQNSTYDYYGIDINGNVIYR